MVRVHLVPKLVKTLHLLAIQRFYDLRQELARSWVDQALFWRQVDNVRLALHLEDPLIWANVSYGQIMPLILL